MGFDEIPEDKQESYPCPECGGVVVLEEGNWICVEPGDCAWSAEDERSDP